MLCGNDPEGRYNIIFCDQKLETEQMGWLYNCTDVQIQLTSNEGWGLSLTEALLNENLIIANVTGGMQDQMRFENEHGDWFTPNDMLPSNHTGVCKKHAPWAFPVFPTSRSIQGSPATPYIWDDRCKAEDAAEQILNVYNLGKEERQKRGKMAREWCVGNEAGFTSEKMSYRMIENIDTLFKTWKPRKKYELINSNDQTSKVAPHNLIY